MTRRSSLETSIKPSTNILSRNQVKNSKNKIQQKSDKQKLRKDTENTKRKAGTRTMKTSKRVIFPNTDLYNFNHSKTQEKETLIKVE